MTLMKPRSVASRRSSTGADGLRQLHQREESPPACAHRPSAVTRDERGAALDRCAARTRAANFSPTALPIEPPMNEKSMTASSHRGLPRWPRRPIIIASPRPGGEHRLGELLACTGGGRKAERVVGAQVGRLLLEAPVVAELLDPLPRAREVVPAVGADREVHRARRRDSASRRSCRCWVFLLPGRRSAAVFSTPPGTSMRGSDIGDRS